MTNPTKSTGPGTVLGLLISLGALPAIPAQAQWPANGTGVCTFAGQQGSPSITSDWLGGAIVAWDDARFGNDDIYAQRINATGNAVWSTNGVAVCTAPGSQGAPIAVPDEGNGTIVIWSDGRNPNPGIYTQRMNSSGVPLWTLNGVRIANVASILDKLMIHDGNAGTLSLPGYILGWMQSEGPGQQEVHVQHIDLGGGALWTSGSVAGIAVATSLTPKSGLAMAGDGVGILSAPKGAVLVWSDHNATTDDDIRAGRVDGNGMRPWSGNGVPVCVATGDQRNPDIVYAGGAQTIVVWDDGRSPDRDIYAQKLNSSGAPQWLTDGLPVCRATGSQSLPAMLSDLAGGAFITWIDQRSSPTRIFGQRIDAAGQPLWAVDGIPLCTAGIAATDPKMMSDAAGGFVVMWTDIRNGNTDVYAQRVDANGNLLWLESGVPVCAAADAQNSPVMATDATGMIAAWRDQRLGSTNNDIFANRIPANGVILVDVPPMAPQAFALALASANPTRSEARFTLSLPEAARVAVHVIDTAGRRVRTIAAGSRLEAGHHALAWDGAGEAGTSVGSGVYFVRVSAGARSATTRVVFLR